MIYITGDTHREFYRLHDIEKNKDNMLIILGDAGINYYLDERDKMLKEQLKHDNIQENIAETVQEMLGDENIVRKGQGR